MAAAAAEVREAVTAGSATLKLEPPSLSLLPGRRTVTSCASEDGE